MSTFSWSNKQNVAVFKISMWFPHSPDQTNNTLPYLNGNVLFVWSGECGHHIFIFNTTTFCLFGQENVESTNSSLIRQRFVCLIRRMWRAHTTKRCRIKDKFVLSTFSWSNKQNVVVFKISMCSPHSPDQTNKTLSY
jgi:hypothetical protein